ncbi:MAG TPA: hypothetical protein VGU72_14635 [Beijerinckiaceae bacterium]|jgi:Leu/Phe-tRNA-protein transferase|nr:hypothetical protein [Beijerinckiaceae bacterium]
MLNYRIAQFGTLFSDGSDWGTDMTRTERRKYRERMFRETVFARFARVGADVGYLLRHIRDLPQTADFFLRAPFLGHTGLPALEEVRRRPDGIAGVIDDVTPMAIAGGYAVGFFPRWILGKATWWSPQARMVRKPAATKAVAAAGLVFELDQNFEQVAGACAAAATRDGEGFGLSPAALQVFANLFDQGFVHCFAVRDQAGDLVAGGFGMASGRVFVTESLFEKRPGAIAFALASLDAQLAQWDFQLHDLRSRRAAEFGFRPMQREAFLLLNIACQNGGRPGRWCPASLKPITRAA